MPLPSRSRAGLLLFTLAVLPLGARAAPAQSPPPGSGGLPCHATPSAPLPRCLEDLTRMSWDELEQLYRGASPGAVPSGYAKGRALYRPGKPLSGPRTATARLLWKGKHFDPCGGTLINQWLGFRAVPARVFYGESWLDGGPSLILDYDGMSRLVWADVRDEIRELAPGLYLGLMFRRRSCPRFKSFFVLEVCMPATPSDLPR